MELLIGKEGGEILESWPVAGHLGVESGDGVDLKESRKFLSTARRATEAFDPVALAQGEPSGLANRYVDVLRRGQIALASEETIALVAQVKEAAHRKKLTLILLLLATAGTLEIALDTLAVTTAPPPIGAAVA